MIQPFASKARGFKAQHKGILSANSLEVMLGAIIADKLHKKILKIFEPLVIIVLDLYFAGADTKYYLASEPKLLQLYFISG